MYQQLMYQHIHPWFPAAPARAAHPVLSGER